MEMTREVLERYCSNKAEIRELQERLKHLQDGDSMIGNDTIFDYRRGYPQPQAVVGFDQARYDRQRTRIQNQMSKLASENDNIEQFVFDIQDSITRRIFQLYYLEGKTQRQIAKRVHMHQSTVSRTVEKFWKN